MRTRKRECYTINWPIGPRGRADDAMRCDAMWCRVDYGEKKTEWTPTMQRNLTSPHLNLKPVHNHKFFTNTLTTQTEAQSPAQT